MIFTVVFTGCFDKSGFEKNNSINVISREDGSGTRGAFVDLFEIRQKYDDGRIKDLTTKEAVITKQTDVMMTSVSMDKYAIGYISMGSQNDTVKNVSIDNIAPTAENVQDRSYPIYRPFIIATKEEMSDISKDFVDFILSKQGQEIVNDTYINIDNNAPEYNNKNLSGKIVVAGSSSVSPLMEKLIEAYCDINPNATIELQTNDSSSGMQAAIEGTCDIAMSSRDLKESEKSKLQEVTIALDGIIIIINHENVIDSLKKEDVRKIFTGEFVDWSDVIQ